MNRNQIILSIVGLVVVCISGYLFWVGFQGEALRQQVKKPAEILEQNKEVKKEATVSGTKRIIKVTRVIDGDTIEVLEDGVSKKIRYIGIDTPETVDPRRAVGCFGKEASNENKRLVEGKEVILEKDVSETDKYSRFLRYVYLKLNDGSLLFVNDYLVRQGFAKNLTYPPDVKYQPRFLQAEREARENNRGLWSMCNGIK